MRTATQFLAASPPHLLHAIDDPRDAALAAANGASHIKLEVTTEVSLAAALSDSEPRHPQARPFEEARVDRLSEAGVGSASVSLR